MTVNNELIDRLLADYKKPEDLIGELHIDIPRDRDGSFEPQIVPKHQTPNTKHQTPDTRHQTPDTRHGGRGSMTRSSRCMPEG